MQVETYEVTEITESGADLEPVQIQLIEQLGLQGQQSLIKDGQESGKSIDPYRVVTKEEHFVYTTLFPKCVEISRYSDAVIPVRVLQVIAHAREIGIGELYVWCPDTAYKDDPVLVAQRYSWETSSAKLLARWGECLRPFDELAKEAVKIARQNWISELHKIKTKLASDIDLISSDQACNLQTLLGAGISIPTYQGL